MTTKLSRLSAGLLLASIPFFAAAALEPGRPAPDCELGALGSPALRELRQLRGRVVYVDFWASWCTACASSFPVMNALQQDLGSRGLEVVGVSVDERAADALGFLREHPALFSVGADPRGRCAEAFDVTAMPSGFLIDREGVVRLVVRGFRERDAAELRHAAERLLAEGGAAALADPVRP